MSKEIALMASDSLVVTVNEKGIGTDIRYIASCEPIGVCESGSSVEEALKLFRSASITRLLNSPEISQAILDIKSSNCTKYKQ
jgi:hypothetical protein